MKIKNDILNILDKCKIEGNILYLPEQQLDRKTYTDVNKCLDSIGGKWNKKAKGHVFEEDPTELLENLMLIGEITDIRKQFQYFPTPKEIALNMIEMADIKPGDILIEPSAGQGSISDYFPKDNPCLLIELNEANAKVLEDKGFIVIIDNFLNCSFDKANKIIMNPPFSKQQDVDHILHAYELLKNGGTLVSVVSESPFFRENKKSVDFRNFLEENNAEVIELPDGAFKESGTMVKTRIIKIMKVNSNGI
jgi:hypothetical protein